MKIGIDARPLISRQPSGIGTFLIHQLRYISEMDKENEYYLYSHQEMEYPIKLGANFHKRVIPGKVGTLWLRYSLPKYLKKDGIDVNHVEGHDSASWILLDYGGVIVHVFMPDARVFYNLERLWADAAEVQPDML